MLGMPHYHRAFKRISFKHSTQQTKTRLAKKDIEHQRLEWAEFCNISENSDDR
jgi:hypothetical protein